MTIATPDRVEPMAPDSVARACRHWAWGIALVLIDVPVGVDGCVVDVLPDVVGAFLVVRGLGLANASRDGRLAWARAVAPPLLLLAVVSLVVGIADIGSESARFGLDIATAVLGLIVGLSVAAFARHRADDAGHSDLASLIRRRARWFAAAGPAILLFVALAAVIDPDTPRGLGDAGRRAALGILLVGGLLGGVTVVLALSGALVRIGRALAGADDSPVVDARVALVTVAALAVLGILFAVHTAFVETDGGAAPLVATDHISYAPAWDTWRLVDTDTGTVVCHQIEGCDEAVAADAKQCVFEGRMRLSSGSDDFVVRRDVTGELWGVAWRMADDGQAWPVDTLASEHVDLGWWWKARGAVVDVERAVACDAVKIEMTLNGAGTFSQTAEAVLRP